MVPSDEPTTDFTRMRHDKFYDHLRDEIAEAAGIPPERVEELEPSEIERRIGVERGEPFAWRTPEQGSRYRSPLLDRKRVPTRQELRRREELVGAALDPDRSYRRLKWRYRARDAYDTAAGAAGAGRDFASEAVAFARDIGRALKRKG